MRRASRTVPFLFLLAFVLIGQEPPGLSLAASGADGRPSGGVVLPAFEGTQNTFFGINAGINTTLDDDSATFVGALAGGFNTSGKFNTFVGRHAGLSNVTSSWNTFLGNNSGFNNTGAENTFVGHASGLSNGTGSQNTLVGVASSFFHTAGDRNTFLGYTAGNNNASGAGNVFLGAAAGYFELGSNKLYIDNSNTAAPLIHGQFDNDILTVNGKLGISTTTPATAVHLRVPGNSTMRMESSSLGGAALDFTAGPAATAFGNITNHTMVIVTNAAERMRITNSGFVGIGQPAPAHLIHLGGGAFSDGAVWSDSSARAAKENFAPVDEREVLEKLSGLPITYWNYKQDGASTVHLGPVAEDFYTMFGLGVDDKGISALDMNGVNAAALKGLYTIVKEKEERIASLEARLSAIEAGGAPAPNASTSQTAAGASPSSWAVAGVAALLAAAVTGAGAFALRRRPAA